MSFYSLLRRIQVRFNRESRILTLLRPFYRWLLENRLWLKKGVPVPIGRAGEFRLHPSLIFGHQDYGKWGLDHNAGFPLWLEVCREKKIIFDIGAHIGLYAMPASRVIHPEGFVCAFEPGELNCRMLARHIRYNGIRNIQIFPYLVGDVDRDEAIFLEHLNQVEGMNTIVSLEKTRTFQETKKRQITVDGFCSHRGISPEIIKIDVEGAEVKVLRGASETLKNIRPFLFLSLHPRHLKALGESPPQIQKFLRKLGYELRNIDGSQVTEFGLKEYIAYPEPGA